MNICTYGVPSCVLKGSISENVNFLSEKVAEIALCFFETKSCLLYEEKDLPQKFGKLDLKWHIHLPFDLPWDKSGFEAAVVALLLVKKVEFLNPYLVVLHPPSHKNKSILLAAFIKQWRKHSTIPVLLENISDCTLADIKNVIIDDNFKVCLDVAHAISFGHYNLLNDADLLEKVGLLHWSAPGIRDQHLALSEFTVDELEAVKKLNLCLPKTASHLLEIFNWKGVELSIPILDKILK